MNIKIFMVNVRMGGALRLADREGQSRRVRGTSRRR
jgi:hypothetical protein